MSGLLLLAAAGCGSSNPNISAAEDALEGGSYDQALQSVEAEIQANPQNGEAYLLKGDILYQQAQATEDADRRNALIDEMLAAYDGAADAGMQDQAMLKRVQAYQQEYQQAAQSYMMADSLGTPEMYNMAAGYFEGASRIQPDSARASLFAANSYLNAGDYERAVEPLERVVDAGGADAEIYVTLGQLYRQNERDEDALAMLEQATDEYPDNTELRSQLLNAYRRTGDGERAMSAYEEAISENPDDAVIRANYGTMLLEDDRFDEAIEQFERVLATNPNDVNTQYKMGVAYRNKAVNVSAQIRELDEERSENSSEMSREELMAADEEISALTEETRGYFRDSIEPLESALQTIRTSGTPENSTLTQEDVCGLLFTAYIQTNQREKAQEIENCANVGG